MASDESVNFPTYPREASDPYVEAPDLMDKLTESFRHVRVGDEFAAHEDTPFSASDEDNISPLLDTMANALLGGDIRAERKKMADDSHYRRLMSISMLVGALKSNAEVLSRLPISSGLGLDEQSIMSAGINALYNVGVTKEELDEALSMRR